MTAVRTFVFTLEYFKRILKELKIQSHDGSAYVDKSISREY